MALKVSLITIGVYLVYTKILKWYVCSKI
jgi:hypothetical protein